MSAATELRLPPSGDDFMLRIENQVYPVVEGSKRSSPARIDRQTALAATGSSRSQQRQAAKRELALAEQMVVAIWEQLPLASKSLDDFESSPDIVRCFNDSHGRLVEMAAEARRLLETVCHRHVLTVRIGLVDDQRQREAEEAKILACMDVAMPLAPLGSELNFETVDQERSIVMEKLTTSLARSVCEMVDSFFVGLEQLVGNEVVGLIEWRTSTCKFHYFRRLIVHQVLGEITQEDVRTLWRTVDGEDRVRTTTTSATTTSGREVHLHIRHEQQLMEAVKLPLGSPDLVIPRDVQEIVDTIPAWLSPFVRVAVGECFRELITPRKEAEVSWQQTKITERVFERAVSYYDPAITIGEFVLAGWGEVEHTAETQRRIQARAASSSRQKAKDTYFLSAAMFGVGAAMLLVSLLFVAKLAWLSIALCLAALIPLNIGVVHSGRGQNVRRSVETFFLVNTSGIVLTVIVAATMLAIAEKRVLFAVGAVFFFCVFFRMFRETVRRLWPSGTAIATVD